MMGFKFKVGNFIGILIIMTDMKVDFVQNVDFRDVLSRKK